MREPRAGGREAWAGEVGGLAGRRKPFEYSTVRRPAVVSPDARPGVYNSNSMNPSVVGIDLGTTFSLAAYVENGRPVVVRDESGDALVPELSSASTDDGTVLVGTRGPASAR